MLEDFYWALQRDMTIEGGQDQAGFEVRIWTRGFTSMYPSVNIRDEQNCFMLHMKATKKHEVMQKDEKLLTTLLRMLVISAPL